MTFADGELGAMLKGNYPNPLAVPQLYKGVLATVKQRIHGTLLVADIGCGTDPISPRLFSGEEAKFLLVDNNPTIELDKSHLPSYVSFAQIDMKDQKAMSTAKRDFFQTYKSLGKGSFDCILLSNVLNYFTDGVTSLSPGEISPIMQNFWTKFVEKNLSKKGVVIIQNGGKDARYSSLKPEDVNDYFSPDMENLLKRSFKDAYYFGLAITGEGTPDESVSVEGTEGFTSLHEYQAIKDQGRLLKAVNLRVLERKG